MLVVDDDADVRDALEDVLREEGFETFAAENGREALDMLPRIARPCVVLLDLMMPETNGWEVLQTLRDRGELADYPVVVMSAIKPELMPSDVPWIRKPFELDVLLGAVRKHMRP